MERLQRTKILRVIFLSCFPLKSLIYYRQDTYTDRMYHIYCLDTYIHTYIHACIYRLIVHFERSARLPYYPTKGGYHGHSTRMGTLLAASTDHTAYCRCFFIVLCPKKVRESDALSPLSLLFTHLYLCTSPISYPPLPRTPIHLSGLSINASSGSLF